MTMVNLAGAKVPEIFACAACSRSLPIADASLCVDCGEAYCTTCVPSKIFESCAGKSDPAGRGRLLPRWLAHTRSVPPAQTPDDPDFEVVEDLAGPPEREVRVPLVTYGETNIPVRIVGDQAILSLAANHALRFEVAGARVVLVDLDVAKAAVDAMCRVEHLLDHEDAARTMRAGKDEIENAPATVQVRDALAALRKALEDQGIAW